MRLGIIIKDKEKEIIGECMSSALWLYIMDTIIASIIIIELPPFEKSSSKGPWINQYLKDQGVCILGAEDFGPKAISSLNEHGISVYKTKQGIDIETQFKLMIKYIEK